MLLTAIVKASPHMDNMQRCLYSWIIFFIKPYYIDCFFHRLHTLVGMLLDILAPESEHRPPLSMKVTVDFLITLHVTFDLAVPEFAVSSPEDSCTHMKQIHGSYGK